MSRMPTSGMRWSRMKTSEILQEDGAPLYRWPAIRGGVRLVAAGSQHALIVTTNEVLMGFGANEWTQLGVIAEGEARVISNFTEVPFDPSLTVKQIALGKAHSLVLTTCGAVYGCGRANQYALGAQGVRTVTMLRKLDLPVDRVEYVRCGDQCSIAVDANGHAYACGLNSQQQLSAGAPLRSFTRVWSALEAQGYEIQDVRCAGVLSIILTRDGVVFTCGRGTSVRPLSSLGTGNDAILRDADALYASHSLCFVRRRDGTCWVNRLGLDCTWYPVRKETTAAGSFVRVEPDVNASITDGGALRLSPASIEKGEGDTSGELASYVDIACGGILVLYQTSRNELLLAEQRKRPRTIPVVDNPWCPRIHCSIPVRMRRCIEAVICLQLVHPLLSEIPREILHHIFTFMG